MEVPSEDPLLNGYFGEMYSVGMQNGSDPRFLQGIATLKHFDANQLEGNWPGPESECTGGVCTRHTINASISRYDWASSYLPAFQRSVVQGGAQAVMCSYNSINGVPSCANELMLGQILRKKWGFRGMVTSDSGAVADISSNHHYAPDLASASVLAISAGCDVESAGWGNDPAKGIGPWATGGPYIDYLPKAVTDGKMKESVLDEALRHTVGLRFR
jgi:beta-glucosidase-like glycosyl hydrolase